jgi:hypothetical protein
LLEIVELVGRWLMVVVLLTCVVVGRLLNCCTEGLHVFSKMIGGGFDHYVVGWNVIWKWW